MIVLLLQKGRCSNNKMAIMSLKKKQVGTGIAISQWGWGGARRRGSQLATSQL